MSPNLPESLTITGMFPWGGPNDKPRKKCKTTSDFRKLKSICVFTKVQIIYKIEIIFFSFLACS